MYLVWKSWKRKWNRKKPMKRNRMQRKTRQKYRQRKCRQRKPKRMTVSGMTWRKSQRNCRRKKLPKTWNPNRKQLLKPNRRRKWIRQKRSSVTSCSARRKSGRRRKPFLCPSRARRIHRSSVKRSWLLFWLMWRKRKKRLKRSASSSCCGTMALTLTQSRKNRSCHWRNSRKRKPRFMWMCRSV